MRKEGWIQTYTGRRVFPNHMRDEDIDIIDIAHALSLICRFGGHCDRFYSVAEHSVRVSLLVPTPGKLAALLHDAAEAYLGDIPRPLKGSAAHTNEENLQDVIFKTLGVKQFSYDIIKAADNRLLSTEGRDLMGDTQGWFLPQPPLADSIVPLSPREAEDLFLGKYQEYKEMK